MALVNSLHLGDHWEVGTGRFETCRKNREYPPEKSGTFKDGHSVWKLLYVADILSVVLGYILLFIRGRGEKK